VRFDAYPGQVFSAEISEIGAAADPQSGTFEVELLLHQTERPFLSGFVAKTTIFPSCKTKMVFIPAASLFEADGSRGTVFILDPSRKFALKRYISIAGLLDHYLIVSEGLDDVRELIHEGTAYLDDSTAVEIQTAKKALYSESI
jgi:multidrug efflux pump subunit AcrA (membrane-fusion protein)